MDDVPEKPKRDESAGFMEDSRSRVAAAVVLIGLGVLFLLQQNGVIRMDFPWWSLFIIVPGLALLASGIRDYMRAGYLSNQARSQIMGGTMATLVGAIFLLDLDWGKVWPLFLIVPGVFMLLGQTQNNRSK